MAKESCKPKIEYKGQKTPGFCANCFIEMGQEPGWIGDHKPKNCRNPIFCSYHNVFGHFQTQKCRRHCTYCRKNGHTMQFCRKLKHCDLCGKRGHNPYRCWEYHTLRAWADRAKKLNRCMQCLTLCTTETNYIDRDGPSYRCPNCHVWRTYWDATFQGSFNCKESQTETIPTTDQESQTELQGKANRRTK